MCAGPAQLVVPARERDGLAVEESPHDLDRFGQASLAGGGWIEWGPDRLVFVERVARAEAEFDAPVREVVERRDLASKVNRMVKVVVEDQRTQPETSSDGRDRHQWDQW